MVVGSIISIIFTYYCDENKRNKVKLSVSWCVYLRDKFEFLGENDEEMDKNTVDNSYSYFTFVCGNVLFYRDASFHRVYSIGYL